MGNPLEVEKMTAEKAAASGQTQKDPRRVQRQKDQMAQKQGISNKSNVVYASEEYFHELRDRVERNKAKDAARVDWRSDLEEHRGLPAAVAQAQDEGNHPYVSVMPHTHKMPNLGTGKVKAKVDGATDKAPETSLGEELDFDTAFGKLVDEDFISEMRKQDKVAGVKPGGTNDEALRYMKRHIKQMQGGQMKKKERGAKPKMRPRFEGPTPAQKIANKRAKAKAAAAYNPYKPRVGESD